MSYGSSNNQGGGVNIIPLIIGILIIIFFGIYFICRESINNRFAVWVEEFNLVFSEPSVSGPGIVRKEHYKGNKKKRRIKKWPEANRPEDQSGTRTQKTPDNIVSGANDKPAVSTIESGAETDKVQLNADLSLPKAEQPAPKIQKKQEGFKFKAFRGENGKYGFKDASSDEVVIEPQYDGYANPAEGKKASFLAVRKGDKSGIIDINNRIIIPFVYDWIDDAGYTNFWKVRKKTGSSGYLFGLVSTVDAKFALPVEYEEIQFIAASFIAVKKDGLYGCVNDKNEVVVPIIYKEKGGSVNIGRNDNTTRIIFRDDAGKIFSYNKMGQIMPD